jgi:hypothetical protein
MYGGNPTLSDLKLKTLSDTHTSALFPPKGPSHRPISLATAVVLLVKAASATDAFTIVASLDSGIIVSFGACLFMLVLTQLSLYVFTRVWSFGDAYTYEDIWNYVFGRKFSFIPNILEIVAYLSCLVVGFWEITDYIPNMLLSIWPDTPDILQSPWFLQYLFVIPILLPCIFIPNVSSFKWIAWICLICFAVSWLCLIVNFFRTQWNDDYISSAPVVLAKWDFELFFQVLSDFNVAFFAHSFVAPIAQEMKDPSRQRTMKMTWIAFTVTAFFSYFIPFVGYLFFLDVPYLENMVYYLNPNDPETIVAKIAVLGISLTSTVFFTYHIAEITAEMIFPQKEFDAWPRFWSGLGLTLPVVCIVIIGDDACDLSYNLAAIAFGLLGFVLPPIYFLMQFRFRYVKWGVMAVIVLLFGLGMLAISLIFTVEAYME